MKKKIAMIIVSVMALALVGCGASVSTERSSTGQLTTKVVNQDVTLNICEHEFPEGYTITDGKITDPIGISYASIDKDGTVVGIFADGYYEENITEDNITDCVNTVFKNIHGVDTALDITSDMYVSSDNLTTLTIGLEDGYGVFIAKMGTSNFAYITESDADTDEVMIDSIGSAILSLGDQNDYDALMADR
ncbi:MAG: hypothetical protein K6E79_03980 [Pseudobutyrivibrio sp.]|nr:hypothetical protein [Pseudobutyrivibrio sp.]